MRCGAPVFALAPGYRWLLAGRLVFGVGGPLVSPLLARLLASALLGRERYRRARRAGR